MLVDTHCHINSLTAVQRNEVISNCQGVLLVDSSINVATSRESIELSGRNPSIYSALGFHPFSAKEFTLDTLALYRTLITEKTIAIGEIGLDETADVDFQSQEQILRAFLQFAKDQGLPVMLHNRFAGVRILSILDEFYTTYDKVVFHCFSYDTTLLSKITDKGGFISFSLNILRKKPMITQSLAACPIENLLLETDSPYMKINGRASLPMDIGEVYRCAAAIRNVDQTELERLIRGNVSRIFSLPGQTAK
jgi:TatD DNase family protein